MEISWDWLIRSSKVLCTNLSYFSIFFLIFMNFLSLVNWSFYFINQLVSIFEQFTNYLVIWNHFDCDYSIWVLNPSIKLLWFYYRYLYFSVNSFTSSINALLIFYISRIRPLLSGWIYILFSLIFSFFILFYSLWRKIFSFSFKFCTHSLLKMLLKAKCSSGFFMNGSA